MNEQPHVSVTDLAYAAALIDALGIIRTRKLSSGTDLPFVQISGTKFVDSLDWLSEITGVVRTATSRDFVKHGCMEHCSEQHVHVKSKSNSWTVTGAKATIFLANLIPYLKVKQEEAKTVASIGMKNSYKTQVVNEMRKLGWTIPDMKPQPRARIQLVKSDVSEVKSV